MASFITKQYCLRTEWLNTKTFMIQYQRRLCMQKVKINGIYSVLVSFTKNNKLYHIDG